MSEQTLDRRALLQENHRCIKTGSERDLHSRRVDDWKEVIPIVKPFYERFFGENWPEDLEDRVSDLKWWEQDKGRFYHDTRGIAIKTHMSYALTADTLIHELAHDLHELKQKLRQYADFRLKKARSRKEKMAWEKKCRDAGFVSEVVAYTVSELFVYLCFDRSRFEQTEAFAEEKFSGFNKAEVINVSVDYCRSTRSHEDGRYRCAKFLGAYLANEYKNDPQLWSKLKQLRTLDDLRRLVDE